MLPRAVSFALIFAVALTVVAHLPAAAVAPGDPAFQRTWQRTDQPVAAGQVSRTWMWGPEANTSTLSEPYAEAPGGERIVQYYDKSRMEITDPAANPNTIWYVTNGLLVVELMTGRLQLGHSTFEQHDPARVNVAGDAGDPDGPTYATFALLRSLPPLADGAQVTQRVNRAGQVQDDPSLAGQGIHAAQHVVVPGIDHQVAEPFWRFMTSDGMVYESAAYLNAALFPDPYYATGYPITEAYWADVLVGGTERLVLMQCFERRCLTYTPGNPEGWQVEAGNVGQHYHTWRYEQLPDEDDETPTATSTITPTATSSTTSTVTTTSTATAPTATVTATTTVTPTTTATATATASPSPTPPVDPATEYGFLRQWGSAHDPGSAMDTPVATAIDADGNIFVVDYDRNRVQKYDSLGQFLLQWGTTGSGNGEFSFPVGIAVDADGNVYVADNDNYRIQKFTNDGLYLDQWTVTSDAGVPVFVNDVAVHDGIVAASAYGGGFAAVNLYDTDGAFLEQVGQQGSGPGEFNAPFGVAFDDRGWLYVADSFACLVLLFDDQGVYQAAIGGCGPGDTEFGRPTHLAVEGAYLYVADPFAHRVKVFSTFGTYIDDIGPTGPPGSPGRFTAPYGIAAGPTGLIITDVDRHIVLKFATWDAGADFAFEWGDDRRGRFDEISGVALGPNGNIYVADAGLDQISRFSPSGELLHAWGMSGFGFWHLSEPRDLAVSDDGRVYVVDQGNDRIQVFGAHGEHQFTFGGSGTLPGRLNAPVGIALDDAGNVYVTDAGNHRVQVFDSAGVYQRMWGSQGNGSEQFEVMRGIAVHDGKVYVLDSGLERVKVFSNTGAWLLLFGGSGVQPGAFDGVNRIAIDAEGVLYLTERGNNRVQMLTAQPVYVAMFGTVGAAPGELSQPAGIAVNQNGRVFVGDAGNHRIQVFEPIE